MKLQTKKFLRTICCAALLVFATPLLLFATPDGKEENQEKIPPEVINQAATRGTVLVLVGLKVPWQMESELTEAGVREQRAAIASIQEDLFKDLQGRNYKLLKRYQEIPGVSLEVGADALAELARLPIVTNVLLDRPAVATNEANSNSGSSSNQAEGTAIVKVPPQLFTRAEKNGTVLVLAGLRAPWQREELLSQSMVALQRNAIQDAQSYVLAELAGTSFRVTRLYRSIPGIALQVGLDALKVLQNSPAVTNVVQDRPAQSSKK